MGNGEAVAARGGEVGEPEEETMQEYEVVEQKSGDVREKFGQPDGFFLCVGL